MASLTETIINTSLPGVFDKGKGILDAVTVLVGTNLFDSWNSVAISRNMNSLCGGFSLSFTDKWKQSKSKWDLKPGETIHIKIGLEPVLTGYIDSLDVSISNEDRTISISGRDKTADLIDCSAVHVPGEFKKLSISAIAAILCLPFGVPVISKLSPNPIIQKWTIKEGESVFENLVRGASSVGALLLTDALGNLLIENRALSNAYDKSSTDLIQGENIISASATYDNSDRYQSYAVKGQSSGDDFYNGAVITAPTASASDQGVLRYRPKVVIAEGNVDTTLAQSRANWEANIRAAKAVNVRVTVQGWLKANKTLWKVNELVRCTAPYVGIDSDMLISGVSFNKSVDQGTTTTLTLTRQDAFNPAPSLAKSKDPTNNLGWDSVFASVI